ncbi:hypothetical protein KXX58_006521, partial [Aspergillus fumigatus]
ATLLTPRLCAQLGSLFSTPEPQTSASSRPLTWAQLVRHVGYPGANLPDADLSIEDIVVQLPEDDRKLLLTGRPWQFLEPEPDENDLVAEIDSIKITVAELSDVSEQSTSWQNATKQSKNTELPNNSSSQHAQSLSDTYGSPPNAARRLKVIDLINISSNQHAQCAPYATASPNAVVQSEDLEPVDNPSRQQSQCPTGPSTPPVSHAPSSACTPNTDAIYSSTATDEQASPSSTASYCTAEETSGLGQPHLELQGQASPQCEGTGDCNRPTYFLQTLRW